MKLKPHPPRAVLTKPLRRVRSESQHHALSADGQLRRQHDSELLLDAWTTHRYGDGRLLQDVTRGMTEIDGDHQSVHTGLLHGVETTAALRWAVAAPSMDASDATTRGHHGVLSAMTAGAAEVQTEVENEVETGAQSDAERLREEGEVPWKSVPGVNAEFVVLVAVVRQRVTMVKQRDVQGVQNRKKRPATKRIEEQQPRRGPHAVQRFGLLFLAR